MPAYPPEELFDTINIEYQHQYSENAVLLEFVHHAISLLEPNSRVLDLGCGTGVPVATTLLEAGMNVTGIDISQRMIEIVRRQAPGGTFDKANIAQYEPSGVYDAVFVIFSHMQMSYREFYTSMLRFAACLRPGGVWVIAAVAADNYVSDPAAYDETGSYAEKLSAPFMGRSVEGTLFTTKGLLAFLSRLGLEVVRHKVDQFLPKTTDPVPEDQLFIIARRTNNHPLMGPYPLPTTRPARLTLNQDVWPQFAATLARHDHDAVLEALESNKKVLDIGSGHGDLPIAIARRTSTCFAIEPDSARNDILLEHGRPANVHVLKGTAEHLPLADKTVDAAIAVWILDHVDDLDASLHEMARVVDPAAPHARLVLVQGAPDIELKALLNAARAASSSSSSSSAIHHGYFLHRAATIFAEHGFGNISLRHVNLDCSFAAEDPERRAEVAAKLFSKLFYSGAEGEIEGELRKRLEIHFGRGRVDVGDQAVVLVATSTSAG